MSFLKNIRFSKVFLFLAIFSLFLSSPSPVSAYDSLPESGDHYEDVFVPALESPNMNLESYVNESYRSLLDAISHNLAGTKETLNDLNKKGTYEPGAIDSLFSFILLPFQYRPVSTGQYLADVGSRLGLAKTTYAQGTGFESLEPVLPLWRAFRNLTYALFALAIAIAGFLVMFRVKISPQAVVTLQSTIPKVVFTLLLITFSYAIAGLVIDAVYLILFVAASLFEISGLLGTIKISLLGGLINLPANMFSDAGIVSGADLFRYFFLHANAFWTGWIVLQLSVGSIKKAISYLLASTLNPVDSLPILGNALNKYLATSTIIKPISSLARTVLLILLFFTLGKILWELVKSYIGILLSVVISPFQIMLDVFPNTQGFKKWLGGLVSNASSFVVVGLMFMLTAILIGRPSTADGLPDLGDLISADFFGRQPTTLGTVKTLPLIGSYSTNALRTLIGLGMIFYIPSIVKTVQAMLNKPLGLESDSAGQVGFAKGLGFGLANTAMGFKSSQLEQSIKENPGTTANPNLAWRQQRNLQAFQGLINLFRGK